MIVTREWLKKSAYKGCGWKREQIKILGERYPLDGNWIDRCVGKVLSDEDARKFEELARSVAQRSSGQSGSRKRTQKMG